MAGEIEQPSKTLQPSDQDEEMIPPEFSPPSSPPSVLVSVSVSTPDSTLVSVSVSVSASISVSCPSSDDEDYDSHLQCEEVEPTEAIPSDKIQELFSDIKGRRAGILKALTTDFSRVYSLCDPSKDELLCLYGLPDETWDVKSLKVAPPEMPEPAIGINYARHEMDEKKWIAYVAINSDVWLLSLTSFFAAQSGFNQESRKELFEMIIELPTIHDVVTGATKEPTNERTPDMN